MANEIINFPQQLEEPIEDAYKVDSLEGSSEFGQDWPEVPVFAFTSKLTREQEIIFDHLVDNRGRACSKQVIYWAIWETDASFEPNTIELHISRLRKKLEFPQEAKEVIETVRSKGYMLK